MLTAVWGLFAAAGLRPPVIHRDIKPENAVLEGGKWGGRIYLIDFGGVQGSSGIGETSREARQP
jgi:serine/threonine protein kinase